MWDSLSRFFARLDQLRRFLDIGDRVVKDGVYSWVDASREARATAIVSTMAELEALVRAVLVSANGTINAESVACKALVSSLRPLAGHPEFVSLSALADAKKIWQHRLRVTALDVLDEPAVLPITIREPQPPLDGRTLTTEHFERVAMVYGLDLGVLFSAASKLSLAKLSDARNDLAHGNLAFHAVFQRAGFTPSEIRNDVNQIEELGYRLVVAFDDYLNKRSYEST